MSPASRARRSTGWASPPSRTSSASSTASRSATTSSTRKCWSERGVRCRVRSRADLTPQSTASGSAASLGKPGLYPPHPVELRPAVPDFLKVGAETGRLVVHAERHVGGVLPEMLLHVVADLLLRLEVRRVEPSLAQRFHFG